MSGESSITKGPIRSDLRSFSGSPQSVENPVENPVEHALSQCKERDFPFSGWLLWKFRKVLFFNNLRVCPWIAVCWLRPAVAPMRKPLARMSAAAQIRSPIRWKPNME